MMPRDHTLSMACGFQRHTDCKRDACRCRCHDVGGVREPRRPLPDDPRVLAVAVEDVPPPRPDVWWIEVTARGGPVEYVPGELKEPRPARFLTTADAEG